MIRFTAFICVGIAFFGVGCSRLDTPNPKQDAEMGRKIPGHGRAPRTLCLQIRVSLVSRSYERQRHATAIKAAAFRGWFRERRSWLLPELRQRRNPLLSGCPRKAVAPEANIVRLPKLRQINLFSGCSRERDRGDYQS